MVSDLGVEELTSQSGMPVWVCKPEGGEYLGGLVLLHERYGRVRHTGELGQVLAGMGFAVVMPHMFFATPDQEALARGDIRAELSDDEVDQYLSEAQELLVKATGQDTMPLGIIGVCQTGRYAFVFAARHPVQACVSLYGAANEMTTVGAGAEPLSVLIPQVDAPVLALFGEKDHVISLDHIREMRDALEVERKSYQITVYGDAPHGWLNDTMAGRYREEAARAALGEVREFCQASFAPGGDGAVAWRFRATSASDYDFSHNVRLE